MNFLNKRKNKAKDIVVGKDKPTMGMPQDVMDKSVAQTLKNNENGVETAIDNFNNSEEGQKVLEAAKAQDAVLSGKEPENIVATPEQIQASVNPTKPEPQVPEQTNTDIVGDEATTETDPATEALVQENINPKDEEKLSWRERRQQRKEKDVQAKAAKEESVRQWCEKTGQDPEMVLAALNEFFNGKLNPKSKAFYISNAIMTAANNIMKQMEASRYNSELANIMNGRRIDPEMETPLYMQHKAQMEENRADTLKGLAEEYLSQNQQLDREGKKLSNEAQRSENEFQNEIHDSKVAQFIANANKDMTDAEIKEATKQFEIDAKRLGITTQELQNEGMRLANEEASIRNSVLQEQVKTDLETAKATLRALKYSGFKGKIDILGNGVEIDAATALNLAEGGYDKIKEFMDKAKTGVK